VAPSRPNTVPPKGSKGSADDGFAAKLLRSWASETIETIETMIYSSEISGSARSRGRGAIARRASDQQVEHQSADHRFDGFERFEGAGFRAVSREGIACSMVSQRRLIVSREALPTRRGLRKLNAARRSTRYLEQHTTPAAHETVNSYI
jgi:hypothetical protein